MDKRKAQRIARTTKRSALYVLASILDIPYKTTRWVAATLDLLNDKKNK